MGRPHERLFPGVLVDGRPTDDGRVVTFASGTVAVERTVSLDPDRRRYAYTVVASPMGAEHHHATFEVVPTGPASCELRWTTDVLPDALAPHVAALMQQGAAAAQTVFGSPAG